MKTALTIAFLFSLTGCGAWDRSVASVTGISKTCIDGVQYLQFTSGASVAYTPNGRIKTCSPPSPPG